MSIIASEELLVGEASIASVPDTQIDDMADYPFEPPDEGRGIVPVAVFLVLEAVLVAEAVSVILLKEVDSANPAGVLIASLLGVALIGNFVAGLVAVRGANHNRPQQYPHGHVILTAPWMEHMIRLLESLPISGESPAVSGNASDRLFRLAGAGISQPTG